MNRVPSRVRHHHAALAEPTAAPPVLEDIQVIPASGKGGKGQPTPAPEKHEICWAPTIWLALVHIGALAAPWCFTWSGLAWVIVMHWITGSIGICLGYHRLLTHTGFDSPLWLRRMLACVGVLAGEGGPLMWIANHRKHHAFSDQPGDPHSPKDGPWWSHVFWLAFRSDGGDFDSYIQKWAPDLARDPFMVALEKWFLPIHIAFGCLVTGLGYMIGGGPLAISWLVYGVFVRMVFVLHTTWFVNSASHMWGYKNYTTRDDSRNLWWVALLAYGEGWHNNHHAHPRLAQHGHRWWEIDWTYGIIRVLRVLGLAKNVVDLKSTEAKKKLRKSA